MKIQSPGVRIIARRIGRAVNDGWLGIGAMYVVQIFRESFQ